MFIAPLTVSFVAGVIPFSISIYVYSPSSVLSFTSPNMIAFLLFTTIIILFGLLGIHFILILDALSYTVYFTGSIFLPVHTVCIVSPLNHSIPFFITVNFTVSRPLVHELWLPSNTYLCSPIVMLCNVTS